MKYILGIDAGTSNVKAVLFDEQGHEVYIASRANEVLSGSGDWAEQDMVGTWEKVKTCIREVAQMAAAEKDNIIGIGVTAQGEGVWMIDKDGNPVRNAILWCDGRAVNEVDEITKVHPEIGQIYFQTTATIPLLGGQMVLLKWMKENEKESLEKADKIFGCMDWIRYKLTGKANADVTNAGCTMLDIRTLEYADDLMKLMGVEEYKDRCAELINPSDIAGTVLDSLADEIGLPRGLPVIGGALDTPSTAMGTGAIHEKDICIVLGTACASEIVLSAENCQFGKEGIRYERHPLDGLYVDVAALLNGAPNINWMLEHIAGTKDFNEIDKIVDSVPVGCGGVIYHPYIAAGGERAPFYDPYAKASFFGISQVTTRADLIRAVYEGLSLYLRDGMTEVPENGVAYIAGGGAKSPVWAQMIADVIGVKVMVPEGKEFGAKAVALITGVTLGLYKDYEDAVAKACRFVRSYEPNPVNVKKYKAIYEVYKKMRIQYTDLWKARHELNKMLRAIDKEEEK